MKFNVDPQDAQLLERRVHTKDSEFDGRRLETSFHVKADDVTAEGNFKGYASVFGVVDQGGDEVQPGAFIEGLVKAKSDNRLIPMLWGHDRDEPLGVWKDIAEDAKGLYVEGELVLEENPLAKRALALMRKKAIGGMSIGYRIAAEGAAEDLKRRGVYLLKKVTLVEISLVTMPMLIQARFAQVKSMIAGGVRPSQGDLVAALREMGYEADLAKAIGDVARPLLDRAGEPENSVASETAAFYKRLAACTPAAN